MESKYGFRRRLKEVYKPDCHDPGVHFTGRLEITEDWYIIVGEGSE